MSDNIRTKEIYLIRHGETDWNVLHKAQGGEFDIPLNNNGKKQAKKTGSYLATNRLSSGQFDLIISSGMKRAHETATIIAKQLLYTKPILIIEDLKERLYGDLGGKIDEEIKSDKTSYFDPYIKAMEKFKKEPDPIKQRDIYYSNNKLFHELYQTELFKDFRKRVKKGLKEIYDRPENKILVISHGGTIIQALQIMSGIDDYIHGNYRNGTNCHISYIKLYEKVEKNKIKRRTKIIKLLTTEHLK